ncbi:nucleotide exchange factor GrpE [Azohydromonas lata]|uniref:Protein GrpE n=1 Tax=Azohydromonas lata TaxID=45677 RepID=A0ABU5IJZ7_9BURK|nr:nucleotide exchange factor GrpE [Azohydromonas lata]MDZ5459228.1 nucleotide exchange factor GrpE [Azohydromonas lata]
MNQTDNTTTPDAAHVPPAADHTTAADAGSAPNGAAETQGAAPSLEQRLSELEARHAEVSEAYLRAKAETENVRRRSEEEMAKARKFAVESFAESLLPVKDSLEAAVANPGANTAQVLEGVQATLRQLSQALERNKVVEVAPPAGTRFDPHQHQAISMIPAEQEPNTVVTVLQKGYLIAERVLRPALVTVAAPK